MSSTPVPEQAPSAPATGRFEGTSVPELLWSLAQDRYTGSLILEEEDVRKVLFMRDGRIVFAASSDPEDRLGPFLLRRGQIDLATLLDAGGKVIRGRRLGQVLIEDEALDQDEMVRAVVDQVREIALSVFPWRRGSWRLSRACLPEDEPVTLDMPTEELVLAGIRRVKDWRWIRRAAGGPRAVYRATAAAESGTLALGLTERAILEQLSHPGRIDLLCREVYAPSYDVYRSLWALAILGLVERLDPAVVAETSQGPGEGFIEEGGAAGLLLRYGDLGLTGVLRLFREGREGAIFLRDGRIDFATTNDPEQSLLVHLLRRGIISDRDHELALRQLISGKRVGTLLAEQGALGSDEVERFVREQVIDVARSLVLWEDGEYQIDEGLPSEESITLGWTAEDVIMAAFESLPDTQRVWSGLGGLETLLRLRPEYLDRLDRMRLRPGVWELVSMLRQEMTLAELLASREDPDFEICRTLYALLGVRVVERVGQDEILERARQRPVPDAVTPDAEKTLGYAAVESAEAEASATGAAVEADEEPSEDSPAVASRLAPELFGDEEHSGPELDALDAATEDAEAGAVEDGAPVEENTVEEQAEAESAEEEFAEEAVEETAETPAASDDELVDADGASEPAEESELTDSGDIEAEVQHAEEMADTGAAVLSFDDDEVEEAPAVSAGTFSLDEESTPEESTLAVPVEEPVIERGAASDSGFTLEVDEEIVDRPVSELEVTAEWPASSPPNEVAPSLADPWQTMQASGFELEEILARGAAEVNAAAEAADSGAEAAELEDTAIEAPVVELGDAAGEHAEEAEEAPEIDTGREEAASDEAAADVPAAVVEDAAHEATAEPADADSSVEAAEAEEADEDLGGPPAFETPVAEVQTGSWDAPEYGRVEGIGGSEEADAEPEAPPVVTEASAASFLDEEPAPVGGEEGLADGQAADDVEDTPAEITEEEAAGLEAESWEFAPFDKLGAEAAADTTSEAVEPASDDLAAETIEPEPEPDPEPESEPEIEDAAADEFEEQPAYSSVEDEEVEDVDEDEAAAAVTLDETDFVEAPEEVEAEARDPEVDVAVDGESPEVVEPEALVAEESAAEGEPMGDSVEAPALEAPVADETPVAGFATQAVTPEVAEILAESDPEETLEIPGAVSELSELDPALDEAAPLEDAPVEEEAAVPPPPPTRLPENLLAEIDRFNQRHQIVFHHLRMEIGAGVRNYVLTCQRRLGEAASLFEGLNPDKSGAFDRDLLGRALHQNWQGDPREPLDALVDKEIEMVRDLLAPARLAEIQNSLQKDAP